MRLFKIGANWCGPCRVLDKLLKDNNIKYEHIDIDTPDGEGLSIKFNVTSIPALVITDDEENLLRKRVGVPTLDELMKFIYETDQTEL